MSQLAKNLSSSTTELITFEHSWTIKNITRVQLYAAKEFTKLESPAFTAPPDQITTVDKQPVVLQLGFYPCGRDEESSDFVTICLTPLNDTTLTAAFKFSFVLASGEKHLLKQTGLKVFPRSIRLDHAMRQSRLYNPDNGFVSNDSITIHCEVNILKTEDAQPELCDQLQDSQPELLAKSLDVLLNSGAYSDVTLVLVDDGGQEFRAHKNILATRSQVFADVLFQPEANRVHIFETRVEVFEQVLNFIYTGKVDTSLDGIAQDLLICADKYQLDPLKSICEEFMSASINPQSDQSDLLSLAKRHNAPKLMAKVIDSMQIELHNSVVQIKRQMASLANEKANKKQKEN